MLYHLLLHTQWQRLNFPPQSLITSTELEDNIFGGDPTSTKKYGNLVVWDLIQRPKKLGGLGVVKLKFHNEGLLIKQLSQFYARLDIP
jgi:hypothetical protein